MRKLLLLSFIITLLTIISCTKTYGPYDSVQSPIFYTNGLYFIEYSISNRTGYIFNQKELGPFSQVMTNQIYLDGTIVLITRNDLNKIMIYHNDNRLGPCDYVWKWRYYSDGSFMVDCDNLQMREILYFNDMEFGPYNYMDSWNYYTDSNYSIVYNDLSRDAYFRINGFTYGPYEYIRNVVYYTNDKYYASFEDTSFQSGFIINDETYGPYPKVMGYPLFSASNDFYFQYEDSSGMSFININGTDYGPYLDLQVPINKDGKCYFTYQNLDSTQNTQYLTEIKNGFQRLKSLSPMPVAEPALKKYSVKDNTNGWYRIEETEKGFMIHVQSKRK